MNLQFIDGNNTQLDLTRYHIPAFSGFRFEKRTQKRMAGDGSYVYGDRTVQDRTLRLTWMEGEVTDAQFRTAIKQVFSFFLADNGPYYLVDTDNSIRINVDISGMDEKQMEGAALRIGYPELSFIVPSPFWEDSTLNVEQDDLSDSDELEIDLDSDRFVRPIITITALADIDEFTLSNESNGTYVTIADNTFDVGDIFTFDCAKGELLLNGAHRENAITAGGLLKLTPGANVLLYESTFGSANVKVEYRGLHVV